MAHGSAKCEKNKWCLGLNWRAIVASPFTREYEVNMNASTIIYPQFSIQPKDEQIFVT